MPSDKIRDGAFLEELDALYDANEGEPFVFTPAQGRIDNPGFYEKTSTPGGRIVETIERVIEYGHAKAHTYYVVMHEPQLTDL